MGNSTSISWTDATWNPVRGCSRVSAGCVNCYAEKMAARFSDEGQPFHTFADRDRAGSKWTGKLALVTEHLADPLRWQKPRRIFVNSMSDLFHERLSNEDIAAVFGVMAAAPRHTFQVLTKRATRMREWFAWLSKEASACNAGNGMTQAARCFVATQREIVPIDLYGKPTIIARGEVVEAGLGAPWPLPNVWIGVSVEDQRAADERIPELLQTPAAVRFLSCEPLIGPVDVSRWMWPVHWRWDAKYSTPDEAKAAGAFAQQHRQALVSAHAVFVDWVIVGCESGTGARACDVAWIRSLRDQCAAARVPIFLKQAVETDLGRCGDANNPNGDKPCGERITVHVNGPGDGSWSCGCCVEGPEFGSAPDVGPGEGSKRKAGGVVELPYLDGVQHAAFPVVR